MQSFIYLIIGTVFFFVFLLPSRKLLNKNNALGAIVWFAIGCALAYYAHKEFGHITYEPDYDF